MKMNLQKLNKHLERHRDNPRFRSVFEGEMTLSDAVTAFYDFEGKGKEFRIREEDPSKVGQRPNELVDLVDGFYDTPIDRSHLEYGEVREGVREGLPKKSKTREKIEAFAYCGAVVAAAHLAAHFFRDEGITGGYFATAVGYTLAGLFASGVGMIILGNPKEKRKNKSKKQIEAAMKGELIREEDKGHYSSGYVNSAALRSRAIHVDESLSLGKD